MLYKDEAIIAIIAGKAYLRNKHPISSLSKRRDLSSLIIKFAKLQNNSTNLL